MSAPNVEVSLALSPSERQLVASLRYRNAGTTLAFIDIINGCIDGQLRNDVFVIVPVMEAGVAHAPLAYTGPRLKRRKPILPDFRRLEPGATAEASVRLDDRYAFPTGVRGTYRIAYSAVHQFPENDDYWELASKELTVTFPK